MIWENEEDRQEREEQSSQEPAGAETEAEAEAEKAADEQPQADGQAGDEAAADAGEEADAGQETQEADAEGEGGQTDAPRDKKDEQIADLKDRLMRQMAEFDNYRKRTDREKAQNYEIGESDFLLKLLPVVDNFERGMDAMTQEDKASSFGQGMEMIYKQLEKLLEDEGVKEIEALGKEFDPGLHNAVMQQPSEEFASGTVMQVLQKGYMFKERVLRHSMVMVAQ